MLSLLRNELLLRPVYNVFLLLLELFRGNLWRAIIVLTLLVRLALYKNSAAGTAMQSKMGDLQPKMKEIQEKYKDDPEQLSKKTMELLKKDGVWPLKGCIGMILQIPVFYGLYAVISNIADPKAVSSFMKFPVNLVDMVYSFLYPFVHNMIDIANMTTQFLWIDVLSKNNLILALIGWILMFLNMQVMTRTRPATPSMPGGQNVPDMGKMMKFMNYFLVIIIWSFIYSVANGVGLYIIASTFFGLAQVYYQNRILINAKLAVMFMPHRPQIIKVK